jgi:NADP-dependent 3-hydroxy acid dehydrogenase YdfG
MGDVYVSKIIAIVGFGPGTATAVAERFGAEGFAVALVGRDEEHLAAGVASLSGRGITAVAFTGDAGNPASIRAAIVNIRSQMGSITAMHWSAYGGLEAGDVLTADSEALSHIFDVSVFGLVAAVEEALVDLKKSDTGSILISNGAFGEVSEQMDAAAVNAHAMGLALSSAAKHKLVGLLALRLKGEGVYVGEVMVYGTIKSAASGGAGTIEPATIAAEIWRIYQSRSETRGSVRPA